MSLVDISLPPTADTAVIHLSAKDNIAIARAPLGAGQRIRLEGKEITLLDAVPMGHKVALVAIAAGGNVVRYGQIMGRARMAIEPGRHGECVKQHWPGWRLVVFTSNERLAKTVDLNVKRQTPFFNGSLACKLWEYEA